MLGRVLPEMGKEELPNEQVTIAQEGKQAVEASSAAIVTGETKGLFCRLTVWPYDQIKKDPAFVQAEVEGPTGRDYYPVLSQDSMCFSPPT